LKAAAALAVILACSGCAANGNATGGDPGPTALADGETCQSILDHLNKLDRQGVPAYVERQNAGKKVTGAQKAQADLYNNLLDKYLGARCHQ
jgi:hypothetical protein